MKVPCSAHSLNWLIENKEFRIIPAPIWRDVQTNPNLPVESRFLWTVLWELCAPNPSFKKALTWGFLSARIGKSESTIRRWARALQKFGYLEIQNVWSKDGGQLPSDFRIGVPSDVAKKILTNAPDRKRKEVPTTAPKTNPSSDQANDKPTERNDLASAPKCEHEESKSGVSAGINESQRRDSASDAEFSEVAPDAAESAENFLKIGVDNRADKPLSKLAERASALGKRSVCSQEKRSEETRAKVQGESDRYSSELAEIARRAAKMPPASAPLTANPIHGRAGEGAVISAFDLASKFDTQETNPAKQETNNNPSLRSIIRRALVLRLGIRQDLEKLVSEFAVSIERGAFKKFELPKAINIGVKLVREGRWKAPRFAH